MYGASGFLGGNQGPVFEWTWKLTRNSKWLVGKDTSIPNSRDLGSDSCSGSPVAAIKLYSTTDLGDSLRPNARVGLRRSGTSFPAGDGVCGFLARDQCELGRSIGYLKVLLVVWFFFFFSYTVMLRGDFWLRNYSCWCKKDHMGYRRLSLANLL